MILLSEGKNYLVYKQDSPEYSIPVVIKSLNPINIDNDELIIKLNNEFEFSKNLDLPFTRQTIKKTFIDGFPSIMFEYIEGQTLNNFFEKNYSLTKFLEIFIKVVDVINILHKNKIVHKNITLDNILITKNNKIKLIDFKYAQDLSKDVKYQAINKIEGELEYISPEQTGRTNIVVDFRTDLYSLGICFYKIITGKFPFVGEDSLGIIYEHIAKIPISPTNFINNKDEYNLLISDITLKLLKKNPDDRYQTIEGLKYDLEFCLDALNNNKSVFNFSLGKSDFSEILKTPNKLFGRDFEISYLLNKINILLQNSKPQFILVKGASGIGKTSLIKEVDRQLQEKNLSFSFAGKFEEFKVLKPYSIFINIVNNFINNILTKSPEELEICKKKMYLYIGEYINILFEIIPQLEILLGKSSEEDSLTFIDKQNRFNHVFIKLIHFICNQEGNLLIFIDDIQWADSSSIKILLLLLNNPETKNLFIISTFRDYDKETNFNLNLLNEINNDNCSLSILDIKGLKEIDINNLIANTINSDQSETLELTKVLFEKTLGNTFFISQFLSTLTQENLLWFSNEEKKWKWDLDKISSKKVSDNVVVLLTDRLNKFDKKILYLLSIASCIGNKFDINTLIEVTNFSSEDIEYQLDIAIKDGLISYFDENNNKNKSFVFLHDKVIQAIYSKIDDKQKKQIHLSLAKILLEKYKKNKNLELLFDLVNHFNISKELITNNKEKVELSELNLDLALRSKVTNDYNGILNFIYTGIDLLPENSWEDYYKLTFELYIFRVELETLIGNYQVADDLYLIIEKNVKDRLDKNKLHYIQLTYYAQQLRYKDIKNVLIKGCRDLGFNIPDSKISRSFLILKLLIRIKLKLKSNGLNYLKELPEMKDLDQISLCNILGVSLDSIYASQEKELLAISVLKIINIAIDYGNNEMTILAYSFYIGMLQLIFNDYSSTKEIRLLVKDLAQREKNPILESKILTSTSVISSHFFLPIPDVLEDLNRSFCLIQDCGNLIYASYPIQYLILYSFGYNENLESLYKRILEYVNIMLKLNTLVRLDGIYHIVLIPINRLSGLETTNVSWKVSENEFFKNAEVFPLMTKLYYYYNIMSYYLLEREDLILEILEKEPSLFDLNITSLSNTDGFFFIALTLLKVFRADNTKKSKYLSKFYKLEKSLKKWSECSPDNYLHKYYLLQAEKNYLLGNFKDSLSFYEKAIHLSEKTGFIQIFALSNKLAGEFCLNQNLEKIARNYFYTSYMAYLEWGALNVANLISEKIKLSPVSSIKKQSDIITKHSKSEFDNMKLDVLSLLKASQTISKEISLSELLTKLILIIKENAGAEKVFLILPKEEKLFIEAYYEKDIVIESIELEKYNNIPISIVNYVLRTKNPILLNDAINNNNFSKDLYVNQFKPKSVLCIPLINQGNVNGVIYMENNLSTDVFTESDLKIVNLLASQATISLENTRLYSFIKEQNLELEEKVLQRTSELQSINSLQKGMIETIVHDLKNPLSNIIMFSKHLENKKLSEERIKKTASLINNSSNHMAKMVENLLEISKIENGTIIPDLEYFDVYPILVESINGFSQHCLTKSIKIHLDDNKQEYYIYADKTRTKQIFENLISNAIKFSPFEKNIYVKLIENEHNIIFSVRDEGYGLTDDDKKKLFKKFSRLSASPTNGEHTTGLGLSIVKKIVELMNSDVWCESEYGSGAEFFVSFPKSS